MTDTRRRLDCFAAAIEPARPLLFAVLSLAAGVLFLLPYGVVPLLNTRDCLALLAAQNHWFPGPPAPWLQAANWRDYFQAGLIYSLPFAGLLTVASGLTSLSARLVSRRAKKLVFAGVVGFLAWCACAWQGQYLVGLPLLLAGFWVQTRLFKLFFHPRNPTTSLSLAQYVGIARIAFLAWIAAGILGLAAGGRAVVLDYLITLRDVAMEHPLSCVRRAAQSYYDYSPWVVWASCTSSPSARIPGFMPSTVAGAFQQVAMVSYLTIIILGVPLLLSAGLYALWHGLRDLRWQQWREGWRSCVTVRALLALATCGLAVVLLWPGLKAAGWMARGRLISIKDPDAWLSADNFLRRYTACRQLARAGATPLTPSGASVLALLIRDQQHPALRYWAMMALARQQPEGWEVLVSAALHDGWPVVAANALRRLPPGIPGAMQYAEGVVAEPASNLYLRAAACDYCNPLRAP